MSTVRVIQNKQRLTKEGNAPLYITFYLGKEKLMLPCKVSVPVAKFDEKSGLLKGNSKEAKDINLIVSNLKARVNDILVKFRLRNQALTKDIFMREYNNPSDYKTFHDFVKEHMKTYSRRIEMGTFKHHLSCMKKFKAYNELLQFRDLTPDYLTDYLIYMKKELGNTEITAQRNMSTIKIYVTAAYRKGYIEENPFQEFHIKRIKSDVDYLREYVESWGVPFVLFETEFDATTDTRKSPCFLCSWNRRKALFTVAKEQGCNKIALGHHMDDILETLLMNITYQGAFSSMPPRLVMKKFDMTIIRPMCLVHEADLMELAQVRGYRKQVKNCPYESQSSRSAMKGILKQLEEMNPEARYSLWGSMTNVQEELLPAIINH